MFASEEDCFYELFPKTHTTLADFQRSILQLSVCSIQPNPTVRGPVVHLSFARPYFRVRYIGRKFLIWLDIEKMASYFPRSESEGHLTTYSDASVLPSNLLTYMNYSAADHHHSSDQSDQELLPGLGGPQIGEHNHHDMNEWKNGGNNNSMLLLTRSMQQVQEGLSLSLSTNRPSGFPMSSYKNGYFENNLYACQSKQLGQFVYDNDGPPDVRTDVLTPNEMPSTTARAVSSSKYLKVAQYLLDEVVNVRNALREKNPRNGIMKDSTEDPGSKSENSDHPESGSSLNPQESNNSPNLLSASEKQDLHSKISKLLPMLDEVDKRYKQYYHQMQIVVSSFEVIAGYGAARPYTALALQTISRHFRCLRDSISDQVQETRKSLGEQDGSGNGKGVGISRLRFVDQQIKQQRNFRQLGIMQQHAWRPQRGLPETSVTVLRAWLFEHFLHPYPKDSDKIMLARQTGLTRSQVSNWFINARVRLWKPMVEEIYKEEIAGAEMDSTEKATDIGASEDTGGGGELVQSTISTATDCHNTGQLFDSSAEVEPYTCYNTLSDGAVIGSHQMSELERFDNGSGVSLTLGLQHCNGGSVPMAGETTHGYMPMRGDGMYNETVASIAAQPSEEFTSRLLHDFVV